MSQDKAAKAFIDASHNVLFSAYGFADAVRLAGAIPASALNKVAIGWFRLMEVEHRYGLGDPVIGELGSRIVHEVLNDYEELPNYNPGRGFEDGGPGARGTWEDYESRYSPSFIRRGVDI
jgi:hypothetical protein